MSILWITRGAGRERLEPPHITIKRKARSWRWGLRSNQFLDREPDPSDVPKELLEAFRPFLDLLCKTWDQMYPENPVVAPIPKKISIEDEAEKSQMNAEIFLVEPKDQPVPHFKRLKASRLRDRAQIRKALAQRVRSALWIATTGLATALLFETLPHRPLGDDQRLLRLDGGHPNMQGLLRLHFKHIVCAQDGVTFLPTEELIEVLDSKNRADLLIGGTVIHLRSTVLLCRGNLESLEIPLSWFVARPGCVQPDSHDFSIGDYGQAIRLGQYEASTDAALYEFDEEYRVRAKKRLIAEDSSIGGAIRRLRLQKGLRQSDFPGVTAKEIARIEKGEVKKPHRLTLEKIAKRTGVSVDHLITF